MKEILGALDQQEKEKAKLLQQMRQEQEAHKQMLAAAQQAHKNQSISQTVQQQPVVQQDFKVEGSERIDSADVRDPLFSLRVTDRNVHEKHQKKIPQLDLSMVTG